MPNEFDPYHQWLGISPRHRPPTHYRLLGIEAFEPNPDVISSAADQRMAHVRSFQNGPRAHDSQELLNQLAAARACLLVAETKAAYDAELRERMAAVRRAVEGEKAAKDPGAAAARDDDFEGFARRMGRVLKLDFQRLRLRRFALPAKLAALGAHLDAENHYRNELTAEFDALDAWRGGQATVEKPGKLAAWRRRRLERALGAAGWQRFGVGAGPPNLTAPLKEIANKLIELDEQIAEVNKPRLLGTFNPRNFAILAGVLFVLMALGCAGLWSLWLLALPLLAVWIGYCRYRSWRIGQREEVEEQAARA